MSDHYLFKKGCSDKTILDQPFVWRMKHNGVRYRVVQIADSIGWKWSVETASGRQKTGIAQSRESAIFDAVNVIDRVLVVERLEPLK
jgi:hypothetical protein